MNRIATPAIFVLLMGSPLLAQVPAGYYDTVDDSNAVVLRQTLHEVIDDHLRFPYTSGSTDTWNILEAAQEDPNNSNNILDIYQNDSHPKQGGGNSFYNREHVWPRSYGIPNDNSSNYPFTDCHMLRLADPSQNNARSNKPFRLCLPGCTEYPTLANNGEGGGSGTFPGNSNWTSGGFSSGTWHVWNGRQGDIARDLLYMDVRYEGGLHNVTGVAEPDLILTDNDALIDAFNTGNNEPIAYMGILSVLLLWHEADPVDDFERRHNDVVYSFQGNRNPFVDHPEWVGCLFGTDCIIPDPVGAYCFGEGCPCGNDDPNGGCVNSTGSGSVLSVSGAPSVLFDSLVLTTTGAPALNSGLYFVGNTAFQPGVFVGDGLGCAGGNSFRYLPGTVDAGGTFIKTNVVSTAPLGYIVPGDSRYFQSWTRDVLCGPPPSPCPSPCANNSNLSNAYQVLFQP